MPNYPCIKHMGVNVVVVRGNMWKMGVEYGLCLQRDMHDVLNIVLSYYTQKGLSIEMIYNHVELLYQRYPEDYRPFIYGMSLGSTLSIENCKVLIAMETLPALLKGMKPSACSFLSMHNLERVKGMIGRNYDFYPPFDECAKYLTVTVMHETGKLPVTFISLPGQIICPTCINSEGLFLSFNNGAVSGGAEINTEVETMLASLLLGAQVFKSIGEFGVWMKNSKSDYSLIVNAANGEVAHSYEFSSTLGMQVYSGEYSRAHVSTNIFQSNSWVGLPEVHPEASMYALGRWRNLIELTQSIEVCDIECFKEVMSVRIENGGALMDSTIYQILYDYNGQHLYIRTQHTQDEWVVLDIHEYMDTPAPTDS